MIVASPCHYHLLVNLIKLIVWQYLHWFLFTKAALRFTYSTKDHITTSVSSARTTVNVLIFDKSMNVSVAKGIFLVTLIDQHVCMCLSELLLFSECMYVHVCMCLSEFLLGVVAPRLGSLSACMYIYVCA